MLAKVRPQCFIIALLLVCNVHWGTCQEATIVQGTITDNATGETIPYANISFKGSTIGAISDYKGFYHITTYKATDTLVISYIGYDPTYIAIRKGTKQVVNASLLASTISLEEVIITPGENPAFYYLDQIYAHKKQNNPDRFDSYQYKAYNKLRLDLNNIDEELMNQRMLKQFKFVFENMDSSEIFGKNYLPVLISESVSNFYFQKRPNLEKEVIEAYQLSGIKNNTFAQFTGKMYQKLNIYQDFMTLFEPGFVSPIADFGKLYYKYYLEDSTNLDGSWCYKISFKPKRKRERTFYGYFWVADTTWAIKQIQLRVASDININFINDMMATNEYKKINDSTWFLSEEEVLIDFNVGDDTYGFFGRRNASYSEIIVDEPIPPEISELNTDTYVLVDSVERTEEYWEANRQLELSDKEADVYAMVDSVKKVPAFRTVYDIAEMLFEYYYNVGLIDIGPYYTIYSTNPIEGPRLRIGGRTSTQLSDKFRIEGHLAYGFSDEEFKYGLSGQWLFRKDPRRLAGIAFYHDIRQLGKSENALLDDNILYTILRRNPNYKLTMVRQYNLYYNHEWFQGFSNSITFRHQTIFPTEYIPFQIPETTTLQNGAIDQLISTEITLHTHYAYREKFLLGKFDRTSIGSKYPTLDLYLTYGPKNVLGSQYDYYKLKLRISDKVEINPIGYLRYSITGGKIFGLLPYPLLELHEGNETYANDRYAFNMMNYYEFASDEYLSIFAEHHFQGFFLSRIPLINFLELREVASVRFLAGQMVHNHAQVVEFPDGLSPLTKPYSEVAVGIENILKLFRIDANWRLSYLDNPNIQIFGVRASMQLTF